MQTLKAAKCSFIKYFLLTSVLFSTVSFAASNPEQLECYAWLLKADGGLERQELQVASYDKSFLEAKIGEFTYLVDTYFLKDDAVNIMIFDTQKKDSTSAIVGFRSTAGVKHREAKINLRKQLGDKVVQAQLLCLLNE